MEYRHHPPTLEELKLARKPVKNVRKELRDSLSPLEHFAVFMTRKVGSMGFFLTLFTWTALWLGWNILSPAKYHFDPAPAFVIWLFTSNIIQLILLPLIMVGQNIESRAADKRAQEDFEVNQKAEREVGAILEHLENQNELLMELVHKIDRN
ncbi:MAG: rane protein-like protein [Parcubacteria group bacterium]|nr:rane protein-like protein [Parcubacteria group bacterium]